MSDDAHAMSRRDEDSNNSVQNDDAAPQGSSFVGESRPLVASDAQLHDPAHDLVDDDGVKLLDGGEGDDLAISGVLTDPKVKPWDHWYGFIVALCVFLVQFGVYGTMNSYSTFSHQMQKDESLGKPSATEISYGNAISNGVAPFISVIAGSATDHLGPRIVLSIAAVLTSVACIASSFATNITTLILLYSLPACIASSCISTPGTAAVASWMKVRLAAAMGIAYAGNGAGSSVIVLAAGMLSASDLGWRKSFRIMAIFPLIGLVAAMFVFHRVKPKPRPALTRKDLRFLRHLLSCASFWVLWVVAAFFSFTFFAALYIIVPFAFQFGKAGGPYEGYEKVDGKTVGTLFTFFGVVKWAGSFTLGAVANKTEPRLVCAASSAILALACCLWSVCETFAELCVVSSFLGFGVAGVFSTLPTMASRCFVGPRCGLAVGMTMTAFGVGGFLGPPIVTALNASNEGSYSVSFGVMAMSSALAGLMTFFGTDGRIHQQEFALMD